MCKDYEQLTKTEFICGVNKLFYTPRDGIAWLVKTDDCGNIIESKQITDWWLLAQPGALAPYNYIHWYPNK